MSNKKVKKLVCKVLGHKVIKNFFDGPIDYYCKRCGKVIAS